MTFGKHVYVDICFRQFTAFCIFTVLVYALSFCLFNSIVMYYHVSLFSFTTNCSLSVK